MNKKFYSGIIPFLFLLLTVQTAFSQNVGINNVNPQSTLDVSGSFGNGIRAVILSTTIAASDATILASPGIVLTLPSSGTSTRRVILVVFNGSNGAAAVTIKPAGTDNVISNNITYNSASGILLNAGSMTLQTDGSGKWYSTINTGAQSGTNWLVTGNAGTVDGTNFLGTTDNVPLTFRVNNQVAGRVDNTKFNAFYGFLAGNGNSTGYDNTFAGDSAGYSNTTGYTNSAFGMTALYSNTTGFRNLAFGYKSLFANTTGNVNVAFGNKTMLANTTGGDNSAFGNASLFANTIGNNNAAFGNYASLANTIGSDNTSIGYATLYSNTGGSTNTAVGYQAMYTGISGSSNTAIGTAALYTTTGSFNSALGNYAGSNSTSGSYNVFVGNTAGSVITSGSDNIFLGAGADATPGSVALTNAAAIGYSALVGASNAIVLGGTGANAVNVGIGITTPLSTMDIAGSFGNNIRAVSVSATLTSTDATVLATPGIIITLPSSAASARRIILIVFNGSNGASAVTIKPAGTDNVISNNITYTSASGIPLTVGSITVQSDGAGKWYATVSTAAQGGTNWLLTGNAGTTSSNFLGTTDNIGLGIRTNNIQRIHVDSLGRVGIGSNSIGSFDPLNPEKLLVDCGITASATAANFTGSINNFLQINIQNKSSAINASSDFVATADNGTDTSIYADFGINSSGYAPSVDNFGGPNDAFLYCNSRNLVIGTQVSSSDVIFLSGGGSIKNNAALRIVGPGKNVVVGKGEGTNFPVGNILRGPNAQTGLSNIPGGDLTLQGGSATTTATGGSVNIYGGATVSGTPGSVNINTSANFPTNINSGTSTQDVTIGNSNDNILFPKFTTVGGMFYTAINTGQISGTTQMIWDNTNTRLGIGITVPTTTLQVNGTASLGSGAVTTGILSFLNNTNVKTVTVQAGITTDGYSMILPLRYGTANQALSISSIVGTVVTLGWLTPGSVSAWQLAGNAGTTSANFLGTTDNIGLGIRTNNIERIHIDSLGSVGIGSTQFDPLNRCKFLVDAGVTSSNNIAAFHGSINNELSLEVKNSSSGKDATSVLKAIANNGTDTTFNIEMGIHSSTYVPVASDFGGPDDGFIFANGRHLVIGSRGVNTDLVLLTGGGSINAGTDLRIIGSTGNVVIGAGEGTAAPVGNVLRGPNGGPGINAGGSLTIQGGAGTATAAGGTVFINGGATASGTPGAVKINGSANFPTNINTGTSNQDVTIGGASNNILFPKFNSIGGVFYTSTATGQISSTGAGTSGYLLQANGAGVAPTWVTASSAASGTSWLLLGNSGSTQPAVPGTYGTSTFGVTENWIGNTDAKDFTIGTSNKERMRVLSTGNVGIGTASPGATLDVNGYNVTTGNTLNVTSNSLTTGTALNVTSTGTILSPGEVVQFTGNSATTGNVLTLSGTGLTTGSVLNATAGTTTGNAVGITANGITTGTALAVSSSSNITSGGNAESIVANSATTGNIMNISGTALTTGSLLNATAGTTTGNAVAITANGITTGTGINLTSNGLTSGKVLSIASTSTAGAAAGSSYLVNLSRSGINTNASHSAYGINASVTNTGTTSTNIAAQFSASGATNNYGIIVPSGGGNVGFGIAAPTTTLQVNGTASLGSASGTTGILSFLNSTNANTVGMQPGITSASYTLTLPTAIGAVNQVLTISSIVGTTAALGWVTPGSGSNWSLTGNAGTVDGTNFLGTTDNVPLSFRVNNQNSGRIDNVKFNSFYGFLAGSANTTGTNNNAIGSKALTANTIGNDNSATGYSSLAANISGSDNVAYGNYSMFGNISGSSNTAAGFANLFFNTAGSQNTAFGYETMYSGASGSNNTAIGYSSLYAITGSNNTALGISAGAASTSGNNNVFVGNLAGNTNTTGSNNTFLGSGADATSAALTNATAIGYSAVVAASNTMILGGTGANAVRVGIGTSLPTADAALSLKDGHLQVQQTTAPTATGGGTTFIGTTGTVALANATDNAGKITITASGTAATASGTMITVTFNKAYTTAPIVIITPTNSATATAFDADHFFAGSTTTTFTISDNVNLPNGTYTLNYFVIETQ